jgi:hypothetical protein
MRSIIVFLFLSPYLCAQPASFAGIALNSITRKPLDGVHISMYVLRNGPAEIFYGAMTDKEGHFSIANMPPAKYGFSAKHNGFVPPDQIITLKEGEQVTDFTVEMMPEAVITGRVLDDSGDPVDDVYARATSVDPHVRFTMTLDRMYCQTDEHGRFRIVGAPGKFYIFASKTGSEIPLHEIRTDGSQRPVYAQTWYPESESQERATVVEAIAGRETGGIDIRLVRKRSLSISGVVAGTPDGSTHAIVFLHSKFYGYPQAIPGPDGKFAFSGLAPDHYKLFAKYEAAGPPLISPTVEIPLETSDETNLSLKLTPGEEVSGTLEIEGHPAPAVLAQKRMVRLDALEPLIDAPQNGGEVSRDGTFQIAPVYPYKFHLHVDPLPENAFLKSVRLDGAEIVGAAVDLSRGVAGSNLKILIGLNGGQVEGTVAIAPGSKASGAIVILAATPDDIGRNINVGVEVGKKYRFTSLRPGKYRLIVTDSELGLEEENIPAMFSKAPEIEVHEGDRIIKDVTIPAEERPHASP